MGATPTSSLGTPRVAQHLDVKVFAGRIAVGNSGSYELRTFSPEGQLLVTVKRPEVDVLRRPGVHERDGRRLITSFGGLDAPVPIGDYWLVVSSWPINVDDPDDYARRQWERLDVPFPRWASAIELVLPGEGVVWSSATENARQPEIGTPVLAHDTVGAVYTVVDFPFPQVQLHRVEVLPAPAEETRR